MSMPEWKTAPGPSPNPVHPNMSRIRRLEICEFPIAYQCMNGQEDRRDSGHESCQEEFLRPPSLAHI